MVNGTIWYSNFDEQYLGRLDPQDRQAHGICDGSAEAEFPRRHLDIGADKDGNLWLGMMYQAAVAKFDPKTEQFQYFNFRPNASATTRSSTWSRPTRSISTESCG